ncbi:hypothetical protein [Streptomyces sp. NPDC051776]
MTSLLPASPARPPVRRRTAGPLQVHGATHEPYENDAAQGASESREDGR